MKRLIKKENGKQVGTIYHFTSIESLMSILKSDSLTTDVRGTISFTRNKNFNSIPREIGSPIQCRITIDGNSLSNKYKIKPFHDREYFEDWFSITDQKFDYSMLESEEIIETHNLSPIKPYITEITIFKDLIINLSFLGESLDEYSNLYPDLRYDEYSEICLNDILKKLTDVPINFE